MAAPFRFGGKTILITGAGGDIGRATALRFVQEGASVALLDIAKLEETETLLREAGAEQVESFFCDVTDYAAVRETVQKIIRKFSSVDLLFNNAGYQGLFRKTHLYPEDDFAAVMQVNVIGAFHVLKTVSEHMAERKTGAIVNTASMAGVEGPPNMIAYGASKFAVIGMTESASKDLAPYGVRVNAVSPAFIGPGFMWQRQVDLQAQADSQYFDSDPAVAAQQMIQNVPMRRYGDLQEIPGAVAFLLSDDASYITGVNIPIAGGIL